MNYFRQAHRIGRMQRVNTLSKARLAYALVILLVVRPARPACRTGSENWQMCGETTWLPGGGL